MRNWIRSRKHFRKSSVNYRTNEVGFAQANFLYHHTILDSYSLDSAAAVLQAAASEADDESEDLARSFVNGDVEIQQFRKEFPDARTKAHVLRLKAEKLLAQAQQAATAAAAPPSGYAAAPYRYIYKLHDVSHTIFI